MSNCRSCPAVIIDWATGPDGKAATPVNRDSADDPKGNLIVWRDDAGKLRFRPRRKGEVPPRGTHTGTSHFATCPDADSWRRK